MSANVSYVLNSFPAPTIVTETSNYDYIYESTIINEQAPFGTGSLVFAQQIVDIPLGITVKVTIP